MSTAEPSGLDQLLVRAEAEVARLKREQSWTDTDDEVLNKAFEDATEAALRLPAIYERSTRMRRLARRFVPAALRPYCRRAALATDATLRRVATALERSKKRGAS